MSTPTTLALPDGVVPIVVDTSRGSFAAHTVRVAEPRGHVLLVPGWTGSKEDMTQVLPLLATAGLDATAYDQRGQHETPGTDHDDYSLHGFGADAVAVGRAVSSTPAHLLGHSFGGLVAQWAVLADPSAWRT
ncbi:MAG: alpha/beta fold hydrolase, partial [Actinomycetales bacterium]